MLFKNRKSTSTPTVRGWIGTALRCAVMPVSAPDAGVREDKPRSSVMLLM
jgi:hypothetical protein